MNKEQKKKMVIIAGIVAAFVVLVIAVVGTNSEDGKKRTLLELGEKYLNELDYESAIAVFDQVLAIDPKCETAYTGKATAQYELGFYEDAMETLQTGIAQIGESTALLELLQKIQEAFDRIMGTEFGEPELQEQVVEVPENKSQFLLLNYTYIVKHADSADMTVQLEVIADEAALQETTTWRSDAPDVVTVSDEGLVTCTGEEGWGVVTATNGEHNAYCEFYVAGDDYEFYPEKEIVTIKIPDKDGSGKGDYFSVEYAADGNGEAILLSDYVYHSGDIEIPSVLQYQGKDVQITQIDGEALSWSVDLERVTIPASIQEFNTESNPFYFCHNLKEIIVEEGNENFKVVDGVLYSADGSILLAYPAGKTEQSFTVPKSVKKIYEGAFCGSKNLEEILVEEGNTRYESVDGALVDKKDEYYGGKTLMAYPCGRKLPEYVVEDSIERIGNYAFAYSSVEKITGGNSLTEIGGRGFWNCSELKSAEGLGKVEYIDSGYFGGCEQLERIEIGKGTKGLWLSGYDVSRELELAGLEEAGNLETLSLSCIKLRNVTDLTWVQNLTGLKQLSIDGEEITDLSPLLPLKNLTYVYIRGLSEDEMSEETREFLQKQLEELRAENPDCEYQISGLDE